MQALRDRIAANLTAFPRIAVETTGLRRAAVAIMLSPLDGQLTYLLTRRALTMRRGAGNYALPGGNFEPGEDAVAAAIRETAEELGVVVGREAALGLLDDFVTLGGHCVTPVKPDPAEVHEAWHASVADLDHPESPRPEAHPDGGEPILRMFARGQWINPPTAAWLYQFREVGLHGRATRVNTVGQPSWTAQ
jgi:8-oxo-dGTP pyrophosphatase MutT (NUDIX family)